MIVSNNNDKSPSPEADDIPAEAPPSYDAVASSSSQSHVSPTSEKSSTPTAGPSDSKSTALHFPPNPHSLSSSSPSSSRSGYTSPWFGLIPSKTAREVRATIMALIQDIIVQQSSPEASRGIIESCAESCRTHGLPLHAILQERYMEGHTPLYWAIVKRAEAQDQADKDAAAAATDDPGDIPMVLLALAAPLSADTITDLRRACVVFSDNTLFQRLRLAPEFASVSGTDQILLGDAMIPDSVVVADVTGGEGAFIAHIRIPKFQRRMRISSSVVLEYIALGRIWRLAFLVTAQNVGRRHPSRPGSWCISLSLMDNSPPTYFNGRLIIPDARRAADVKPKADLSIPLKSEQELAPMQRHRKRQWNDELLVELEGGASSLQFTGSPYVHEDDTLFARLEGKLAKPDDTECIIC
ncbi:hypothetical protein BD626DRAFT_403717 [Schizophyllum amplum]|uniref:Uncharacterized protein n=1 Tax=Schizophyllum amplum TaxID=97359 RepID=A0A550CD71_9AGAR|nr:hypothetical protein BD626DRAFT_403717 [Auriculariopsis ampla]